MIKIPDRIRFVFFDVDGVLSAPQYYDEQLNEYVIGFSDETWNDYLDKEGVATYQYCKPVKVLRDLMVQLKDEGINTYVLSTIANDTEAKAKISFLDEHYHDLFTDLYFVEHDRDKVTFIKEFAGRNNIEIGACLLVDDTYALLLECRIAGISCCHLSNILADNITR